MASATPPPSTRSRKLPLVGWVATAVALLMVSAMAGWALILRDNTVPPSTPLVQAERPLPPATPAAGGTHTAPALPSAPSTTAQAGRPCFSAEGFSCLRADQHLHPALTELFALPEGRALLRGAASFGVVFGIGEVKRGAAGVYSTRNEARTITLSTEWLAYGPREHAAVLAHELRHAEDDRLGLMRPPGAAATLSVEQCLQLERRAFEQETAVWLALWGDTLPTPTNNAQRSLNAQVQMMRNDASAFDQWMRDTYTPHCTDNMGG